MAFIDCGRRQHTLFTYGVLPASIRASQTIANATSGVTEHAVGTGKRPGPDGLQLVHAPQSTLLQDDAMRSMHAEDSCGPEITAPSPSQRLSISAPSRDTHSMAAELEYLQRRVLELESQARQMSAELGRTGEAPRSPLRSDPTTQEATVATDDEQDDDGDSTEGEDGDAEAYAADDHATESGTIVDGSHENRRDTSDTVIKDAASILEFLAWGRRKDPEYHPITGRRSSGVLAAAVRADAGLDVEGNSSMGDGSTTAASSMSSITSTIDPLSMMTSEPAASGDVNPLSWRAKTDAPFGGRGGLESLGAPGNDGYSDPFSDNGAQRPLAVVQLLLPVRRQVEQLVTYHVDCLLWYHASFLALRFRADLADFYDRHGGSVEGGGVDLQWVALLFAVLAGSLTCATAPQALSWGFREPERHTLCKHWFQAALACLGRDQYMANHSIYACQAIATLTISAHMLGFSNTQSIQLAAAVRIAQSLGLHRLGEDAGRHGGRAAQVEAEMGRRVWNQLCSQDWFGIPFSESYLVNPLHSQTAKPANCHDEAIDGSPTSPAGLPESEPTVSGYCRFLHTIASIMPRLQDGLLACNTAYTRYQQVLAWDAHMRTLATADRPLFLSSQVALQPHWPVWIPWARRALAISSGHKIIMIHRSCLSESFTNPAFAFTRHTCVAASKTIIKEYKAAVREEGPVLWAHQAFSVAASIILILDVLHRRPGEARQHAEHARLVEDVVGILRQFPHSMIAIRGIRLLRALLDEVRERASTADTGGVSPTATRKRKRHPALPLAGSTHLHPNDHLSTPAGTQCKVFNVPAFIRDYCQESHGTSRHPTGRPHQRRRSVGPRLNKQRQQDTHAESSVSRGVDAAVPGDKPDTDPTVPAVSLDGHGHVPHNNPLGQADLPACFTVGSEEQVTLGYTDPSLLDASVLMPPGWESNGNGFENLLYLANHDFSLL